MSRISQRGRILGLASRRIVREAGWSLLILGVLSSGLTAWILIPSVASSLQSGVSNYSNGLGTYMVVGQSGGKCVPIFQNCALTLPQNTSSAIASIPGVVNEYPIILNATIDTSPCWGIDSNTGKNTTYSHCYSGHPSALLGGPKGFPPALIALSHGAYPGNAPEVAISQQLAVGSIGQPWRPDGTKPVAIGCLGCVITSPNGYGNITDPFNATIVGVMALNPLFYEAQVVWNSTYMFNKLGPALYRQTWDGNGSNFIIIKVDSVADIPRVANQTDQLLLKNPLYGNFGAIYNQALSQSLQSFQTQTAPLYELVGAVSLIAVTGVSFLVAHLIAGRRDWEAGIYLTQGWSWRDVYVLYSAYFLTLSLGSFVVATVVSFFASQYFTATYDVFGTFVTFTASVVPLYLVTGFAFAIVLAFFASYTIVRRLRRMGLDNIVREY